VDIPNQNVDQNNAKKLKK